MTDKLKTLNADDGRDTADDKPRKAMTDGTIGVMLVDDHTAATNASRLPTRRFIISNVRR